jgi:hypothetical protein
LAEEKGGREQRTDYVEIREKERKRESDSN